MQFRTLSTRSPVSLAAAGLSRVCYYGSRVSIVRAALVGDGDSC